MAAGLVEAQAEEERADDLLTAASGAADSARCNFYTAVRREHARPSQGMIRGPSGSCSSESWPRMLEPRSLARDLFDCLNGPALAQTLVFHPFVGGVDGVQ
jgi:hypothetical protein